MISSGQKKIILFTKNKIKKKNYFHNIFSYFAIFQNNPGTCLLKTIIDKKRYLDLTISYFKHVYGIKNVELNFLNCIDEKFKYEKIIVSWAFKNNFKSNGIYHDKYLKKNSSDTKSTIWFLIYMDEKLPKKIADNIILVHRKINFFSGLVFFLNYLLFCLKKYFIGVNFFKNFNVYSAFSNQVIKIYKKHINLKNIKYFFITYEGQIFQKDLIRHNKNYNSDIKNIAYDHSAPPPMPLNLIHDNFSPDILYITGSAQEKFYQKHLLWPKKKIKLTKSFRFKNEKKADYINKIFLPFELYSEKKYLKNLDYLFKCEKLNLKNYQIKKHPLRLKDQKHIDFVSEIREINHVSQKKNKNHLNSIFFGQTTAIIIALEFGINCYHICTNPVFDSYSSTLWPDIKVNQINNNVFKYELKKKKTFINFSSKKEILNLC